jgi:hypothetical protein
LIYSFRQTPRNSSILAKGPDQELEGEEPFLQTQPQEDNEPVDFGVPFDDDSEGPEVGMTDTPQQPHDHSMSQASEGAALNMSGLDEEDEDEEASASKKRPAPAPKPRRRKRRKVVIDNENTELSNEQIKAMLADTDDIVRRKIHPAEDYDEKEEETTQESSAPVLTAPFLASKGLHPALQELWADNFYQARDQPCPFEKEDGDEEELNDAEGVRQEQEGQDDDDSRSVLSETPAPLEENAEQEEPEEDGFGVNMDDDEEEDMEMQPMEQAEGFEDEDSTQEQPEGMFRVGCLDGIHFQTLISLFLVLFCRP